MLQTAIKESRLSPQQERLWRLQSSERHQPYRAQCAILIEGNLNEDVFGLALRTLVNRHEILRTTFRSSQVGREPSQVVSECKTRPLRTYDLSRLDEKRHGAEIEALFAELSQERFDLEHGPVFHLWLGILSPSRRVLLISISAFCADAVTLNNLVEEISRSYAACLRYEHQPHELLQYADISEVLNELLEDEDSREGEAYWRKKDLSPLATLKLPFEAHPPGGTAFNPATLEFGVSAELADGIRDRSQMLGASVPDFLLTCWTLLLWRLCGQSEMVVGLASDGRSNADLAGTIGPLARHVPVCAHLQAESSFSQALFKIAESRREAYEWQDYFSWSRIAELGVAATDATLFPYSFQIEKGTAAIDLDGVTFRVVNKYACIDRFKINLSCARNDEGLTTKFHFDSSLYSASDINRLAAQFHTLLESAVTDPDSPIYRLEVLSAAERSQFLARPDDAEIDRPGMCLHEIFERQAARTPDSIAVVCGDECLDYASLNARANRVAHRLQRLGVGPDVLVALYIERSLEMVIALVGILKAGGAYVPLDSAYPKQRILFVLDDTKAPVVVTARRLVDQLPQASAQLLCIDEVGDAECAENPAPVNIVDAPAYVIYTSGSTGNPKGVVVSHSNAVRLFTCSRGWFGFSEYDVFTLFHSYAFDFSVWEIWGALLFGGRLVVVPYLLSRSPEAFYELLYDEGVTVLNQTPSAFRQLMAVEDRLTYDLGLRFVIFGGEALELQSLKPWFNRHADKQPQLINMYGITETTVHVTYRPIAQSDLDGSSRSVIGRALPDLQIYILDRYAQLVPLGVAGEIYVGGAGVASGYLNRAELTAQKFTPDPFASLPGSRLYRSGDLASCVPCGDIEYLGRIDNQIKIRGFRIELGEIESALAKHPSVREAVVLALDRSDGQTGQARGDKQLVAYVVCGHGHSASVGELRRHMEKMLPIYMAPSSYVMLRALPLTVNGKVDYKALPAPEEVRPELDIPFITPRTPVEEELAQIWSQFLRVEPVGIYDNFFQLGGHSLLLTQLASRVSEVFQVDMPLAAFFENPTVAQMTAVIAARQAQQEDPGELAEILSELKHLSPDEVQALLEYERS
jgi:amino acid adenylation domain-containing protein